MCPARRRSPPTTVRTSLAGARLKPGTWSIPRVVEPEPRCELADGSYQAVSTAHASVILAAPYGPCSSRPEQAG